MEALIQRTKMDDINRPAEDALVWKEWANNRPTSVAIYCDKGSRNCSIKCNMFGKSVTVEQAQVSYTLMPETEILR
jgi:hypothetical protein